MIVTDAGLKSMKFAGRSKWRQGVRLVIVVIQKADRWLDNLKSVG